MGLGRGPYTDAYILALGPHPPFPVPRLRRAFTMTETNSPDWEQRIRVFADSDLEPEELRQEAATLLDNADSVIPILHGCEGIRTKFVDKIDEVRHYLPLF